MLKIFHSNLQIEFHINKNDTQKTFKKNALIARDYKAKTNEKTVKASINSCYKYVILKAF